MRSAYSRERRPILTNRSNSFCGPRRTSNGLFVEACLLCLLKEDNSYGYSLMENLSRFGFMEDEVDISTIYRKLRTMEKDNLVISSWIESDQGPKKRIYKITDLGIEELDQWIDFLADRKKRITLITDKYRSLK